MTPEIVCSLSDLLYDSLSHATPPRPTGARSPEIVSQTVIQSLSPVRMSKTVRRNPRKSHA